MLYLRTGLPGAGKTLNAIREIDLEHQPDPADPTKRFYKDPDHPDLPPRTIYYYGIPELKAERLKSKWVEFETPEQWFNQPDGSVIVIDEAQRIFGNDGTRARPEKVTRFETHRHQGLDIHLITQHPSLLSTPVRKLVGKHINFIRPYGREKGIFRHEYEFCIDSPEKRVNFKQAQEEKVSLDASYFGVYKSSTVHTHKPKSPAYLKAIPLLVGGVLLAIGLIVALGYGLISNARKTQEDLSSPPSAEAGSTAALAGAAGSTVRRPAAPAAQETAEALAASYIPRVPGLPQTAPRYDELTKPKDFPRPVCAASSDPVLVDTGIKRGRVAGIRRGVAHVCHCMTQQASRLEMEFDTCMDIVENGYFDDTRQRPSIASGNNRNGLIDTPATQPAAIQRGRAAASPPADESRPVPSASYVQGGGSFDFAAREGLRVSGISPTVDARGMKLQP